MDGRVGIGHQFETQTTWLDLWTSAAYTYGGTVVVDQPISLDGSADPDLIGVSSVIVGIDVLKGLASVWQESNVSQLMLYADLTPIPEPSGIALVAFAALAFMKRR